MPPEIFASSERVGAYLARMLFVGALMGFNFFISEYMQIALRFDSLKTGLGFFPVTICTFLAAVKVPDFVKKYGNYKTLFAGLVLMIAGFALLGQIDAESRYFSGVAVGMVFVGFGQGLGMSPLTNLGISGIDKRNFGAASGVVNAAHQIGGAVGLSTMVSLSRGVSDMAQACKISMIAALIFTVAILFVVFFMKTK